jgi:Na+/H+-dicarboxylate symporter
VPSPTLLTFLALVVGLAAGALLGGAPAALRDAVIAVAEPVGTVWTNAIRMTVVPLVMALLVGGVAAAADPRVVGRLGARALALFLGVLAATAGLVTLVAPLLLARLPLDPAAVAALRRSVAPAATGALAATPPTLRQWIVELVPTNPVRAAADGTLLPLVVFTLGFALAIARLPAPARDTLVTFARAVGEALLVVVRWVLALAPAGVLALALPLGARVGAAAAGALAGYVGLTVLLCAAAAAGLVGLGAALGGVSPARLVRAAGPAQVVAAGTRSSLAALPALVRGVERHLDVPAAASGFVVPLAMATFRIGATIGIVVGTHFLARLYGVALDGAAVAAIAAAAVLLSFGIPGVPGGVFVAMAPVLATAGIPAEGLGILLAVDVVPDAARTLANTTGHLVAVAVVGRRGAGHRAGDAGAVGEPT